MFVQRFPNIKNLIIDITTLPKKFFFLTLKEALLNTPTIENIIITYSDPVAYSIEALAEDPEEWNELPGFSSPFPEPTNKHLIIGTGFEPLGLPRLITNGNFEGAEISLLLPFPSQPRRIMKNWEFIKELSPDMPGKINNIHRVDARNVPEVFDTLVRLSDHGTKYTILAPYGPKPMSLAMCLFAIKYSSPEACAPSVSYTQPVVYNPEYSRGIGLLNGMDMVSAYCVRINSTNVY